MIYPCISNGVYLDSISEALLTGSVIANQSH
jgi:hypothetical protein